jgi:uridine kinase
VHNFFFDHFKNNVSLINQDEFYNLTHHQEKANQMLYRDLPLHDMDPLLYPLLSLRVPVPCRTDIVLFSRKRDEAEKNQEQPS